jgi:hypothetical protein
MKRTTTMNIIERKIEWLTAYAAITTALIVANVLAFATGVCGY